MRSEPLAGARRPDRAGPRSATAEAATTESSAEVHSPASPGVCSRSTRSQTRRDSDSRRESWPGHSLSRHALCSTTPAQPSTTRETQVRAPHLKGFGLRACGWLGRVVGGFAEAGSWTRKGEVAKEETLLRSDRQLRMSAEEKDVEMRGFKPCCTSAVACSTSGALQCGCIYPEAGAATPDAYALLEHLLMCPAQNTHARRLSRRASPRERQPISPPAPCLCAPLACGP